MEYGHGIVLNYSDSILIVLLFILFYEDPVGNKSTDFYRRSSGSNLTIFHCMFASK